jgi:hypothetical protein
LRRAEKIRLQLLRAADLKLFSTERVEENVMKTQSWFQKDAPSTRKPAARMAGAPAAPVERTGLAARLRPHELIAMLTHHYTRVRARSLPRVKTTLSVATPRGKQAVIISFG